MAPLPETSRENGKKGGRPKGSMTKLTRSLANELVRQGCDGLSVMVGNMMFWKDKAEKLGEAHEGLIAKLNSLPPEQTQEFADTLKEFNKVSAYYIAARDKSQECGRDVAPYTNPRLAAITLNTNIESNNAERIDEENMTPQQAAEAYASSIRTDNIIPFKRMAS